MPLPSNADQVVVQGFLFDEETGGGLQAAVTSEPVALAGQSAAPMVLDAVSHAHIQTRPRVTTPDPVTGYWALLALATNDPDLEAYGGRRITLPGQVARTIEVPWDAPQQVVSAGMAAQINPGNVDGRPKAGDTVRVLWFHSAAGYVAPTPASAYYDAAATRSLIADSIAAAGGGSGTADLPEVDRTTAASDPTTLLAKTTRFNTTSAAVAQTLPAAQPGRQLAVGWDAGTNALTLTAAGSDVVGAGSATTVPFAVLGHLVTLHCTVAGRWRVTSGFTPQSGLDARYMPRPDETGAAAGADYALRKTSGGYALRNAGLLRRQPVFHDASDDPNGTITTLDSGQTVTNFGNAPLTVSGGKIVHTPFQGANSAGYIQAVLPERVHRFGARVRWAPGANGAIALVLPSSAWTDTPSPSRTPAGVHLPIYGNGIWHCSYFNSTNNPVEQKYLRWDAPGIAASEGRFADCRDGVARDIEGAINPDTGHIWIQMPDGTFRYGQSDRIIDTCSNIAIWELFESDGTTTTPGEILSFWADDGRESGRIAWSTRKVATAIKAATPVDPAPNPKVGNYFFPVGSAGSSATLMTASRLTLTPWLVRRPITLDRLAAEITTAGEAGSKFRLGIYADDGTTTPGALLVDAGQIDADSIGVKELTVSLTLQPGLYWLCAAAQSVTTTAPTVRCLGSSHQIPTPVGITPVLSVVGGGLANAGYYVPNVTGAFPTPLTGAVPTGAANLARLIARSSANP